MSLQEVKKSILIEASEDYVGLWSIIKHVKNGTLREDFSDIQQDSLNLMLFFLSAKLLQAGNFTEDGRFEIWEMEPSVAIERIKKEWNQLGREPNIGDIVWFIATEEE